MNWLYVSWIVFWLGAGADWYTTKRGLKKGAREMNPLFNALRAFGMTIDAAATALKASVFIWFLWTSAPPVVYFWLGGFQFLAALSNHYGWLGKLMTKWRDR